MAEFPSLLSNATVALAPAQIVAELPENTFLESIVVTSDHQLYVSSHEEGKIYRLTPQGAVVLHAQIAGKATGLA
ncbi:MAG: hypothetical protein WCD18_23145, partial [Thermosynechococcaceae cyanobacterium]